MMVQSYKTIIARRSQAIIVCGELGIRTPGTFNSSTVFKTAAIDHSANSPGAKVQIRAELASLMFKFFYRVVKPPFNLISQILSAA